MQERNIRRDDNMNHLIIAPSVLSLDWANASEDLDRLKNSKAQWIHYDVMDGHFVPNITFGMDIMEGFKKRTNMFMDVHLMISDPAKYSDEFIARGADMITFHYEAMPNEEACIKLLKKIKNQGCQAGIVIKPKTDVQVLKPILPYLDMVLVMSVEPGFGGQKFQPQSLEKIHYLNEIREKYGYQYRIEIDGGINDETGRLAVLSGCDTLVAGSYVFKGDIEKKVDTLLCLK